MFAKKPVIESIRYRKHIFVARTCIVFTQRKIKALRNHWDYSGSGLLVNDKNSVRTHAEMLPEIEI